MALFILFIHIVLESDYCCQSIVKSVISHHFFYFRLAYHLKLFGLF